MSFGNEQLFQYEIKDFSGGLVDSFVDINIPLNSGDIAQNVRFNDVKGITKRLSRSEYNATSLGANPIMFVKRIYISGNRYFLCVYSTNLKVGSDSAGTFSNLDTVTAGKRYTSVTYKNFCYIFNGTDANMKTAGTSATSGDMGCTAPTANPTGAKSNTGSNLDEATYQYKFSYIYDSYQESNVYGTALSVATDGSNLSINLHTFGTLPANCTHVRIYRTEGGGSDFKYHSTHTAAQIAGYTAESPYNDDTADGSLTTTYTAATDNGTPPACKYGILHKDRIFIAGYSTYKSRVYYSKISAGSSYPDIFPAANYIDIAPDDGDEIMGLAHDPSGQLCVLKRNSIRKIYTDGDPVNWSVSEPFTYDGCIAPYTISESRYGIIYLSRKGEEGRQLRLFNGQTSEKLSDNVDNEINKIERTRVEHTEGFFHNDTYFLTYTDNTTGHTYNDRVLVFDVPRKAWGVDVKNVNCFCSWYGANDRGELYTGDSVKGQCYREDTNLKDTIVSRKSDLDGGTFSQLSSSGTEAAPSLHLTSALLTDDYGYKDWSALSTTDWSALSGDLNTWGMCGTWISAVAQINATAFTNLYWNETLGSYGEVFLYIRTGATSEACQAADWEGPYTSSPADISDVTAAAYIQIKVRLTTTDYDTTTTPTLDLAGVYMVRVGATLGTAAETSIEFNWRSGQMDLGYPRQKKRFRGMRIEYDSGSSGNLYCYYSIDRGTESSTFYKAGTAYTYIDLSTYTTNFEANFPYDSIGKLIRLRFNMDDTNSLTIKRVVLLFTVKPPVLG